MEHRRFFEELVGRVAPNATVVDVTEAGGDVRVTIAGTTTVTARCDVPRDVVGAARARWSPRHRLAAVLKQCADATVAPVPDGRF